MVTMVLEVVYFPFHDLLDFSGALGSDLTKNALPG
jgi:hypothetical protein